MGSIFAVAYGTFSRSVVADGNAVYAQEMDHDVGTHAQDMGTGLLSYFVHILVAIVEMQRCPSHGCPRGTTLARVASASYPTWQQPPLVQRQESVDASLFDTFAPPADASEAFESFESL